ncbi:hypothetical protein ABZ470_23730 [Streptosporangium sp. NPDC020072]|uniref:hypothetical protein n=1 Tax=Streptosporangium sp. NPDC020072 TaxID=3154788 RepID=UPI00342D203A
MTRNQATYRPGISEAKRLALTAIREGKSWAAAMASVGRSERSYENWIRTDPAFRAELDLIRTTLHNKAGLVDKPKITFEEFRKRYLRSTTFPHQLNLVDVIEGRGPRWLHPSMRYEAADPQFVLINIPPDHAKTVTISIDYATYLICTQPQERIVLVSKTQELAKQMLWAIKQRLTHPNYRDLQADYGPAEGFDSGDAIWQQTQIYLPSDLRDPDEKDPTVQCIGLGGQIYGVRSTLILIDDAVLLSNANQYESQLRWLQQDVISRVGDTGRVVVIGTRVDSVDLYRELRSAERYEDGRSPWTYLSMPALLEGADDSRDWVTLWPRSDRPWPGSKDGCDADGMYPRWDGPRLARRRSVMDPRTWSLVYQQQDVSSDAIFSPKDVRACVNGRRTVGLLSGANENHGRPEGMQGLSVICAMDPAMAGETATVAYAVDPRTLKRWVLEAHRMRAPSPQAIRDLITAWTIKYEPTCWVIEKNAFQIYLTRDEHVRGFLASRGIPLLEHYTGTNKLDPDFGVASLAPLFTERMIELPSSHNSEGIKALIEQLITWRPGAKGKDLVQDLPMALWFAEIKAREIVDSRTMRANSHTNTKYVPRYRRGRQTVVRIDDYLHDQMSA